jgi:hypothetical protein
MVDSGPLIPTFASAFAAIGLQMSESELNVRTGYLLKMLSISAGDFSGL